MPYRCRECRKHFNIQLAKLLDVQQRTVWFLEHRIRQEFETGG